MKRLPGRSLVVLLMLTAIPACVSLYQHDELSYDSAEAMLAAVERDQATALSRISPLDRPLSPRAIMALPTRKHLTEQVVVVGALMPQATVEQLGKVSFVEHRGLAEAIRKRNLFADVEEVPYGDHPPAAPATADYVAVLVDREKQERTLLVHKRGRTPTEFSIDDAMGPEKYLRALSRVESAIRY